MTSPSNSQKILAGCILTGLAVVFGLLAGAASGLSEVNSCAPIYQDSAWTISTCPDDLSVPASMAIWLNGVPQAAPAARLEIAHLSLASNSRPTVAVLYASGYVRLKPNLDPDPAIPFGTSVVLGPAYWSRGLQSPQSYSAACGPNNSPASFQMDPCGSRSGG